MDNYRSTRRVLRSSNGEVDVRNLAEAQDWAIMSADAADPERGTPARTRWRVVRRVLFQLTKDVLTGREYYFLAGRHAEEVERCAHAVAKHLDAWDINELVALEADQDSRERGQTIMRLGLAAPYEFEPQVFAVIQRALADASPDIRNVGVFACSYSPWPNYRPLLEKIRAEDPSPELRETAGAALRAFDSGDVP